MPELPEVEVIARGLDAWLPGQIIQAVAVFWPRSVACPAPESFAGRLAGRRIGPVGRRGKFVHISLDDGAHLFVHLRMTGTLCRTPAEEPLTPYVRAQFRLAGPCDLRFADTRKFGRLYLAHDPRQVVGDLGPEPLGEDFTAEWLTEALAGRRTRLKPLLLDQRFIAGLGNIYVDESLYLAGLHPLRPADSLEPADGRRLHAAIQEVLRDAIARRGTTLRSYRDAEGDHGENQGFLRAYGRTGLPCRRCGRPIERIIVGQRSTHFCPDCQPDLWSLSGKC
jgi:formamidopyrimidine-DNA glycosylase